MPNDKENIMSAKTLREYNGKKLLSKYVSKLSSGTHQIEDRAALITPTTNFDDLLEAEPWLIDGSCSLVVKPDQLIKRRGKVGLVGINLSFEEVKEWIDERMNKKIKVEHAILTLDHFIVEPFLLHRQSDEYYVCIHSVRSGEEILFYKEGGVDIGDVELKAKRLHVDIDVDLTEDMITSTDLLEAIPEDRVDKIRSFVFTIFNVYRMLNFAFMEINRVVFTNDKITPLDLAVKIGKTTSIIRRNGEKSTASSVKTGRKKITLPSGAGAGLGAGLGAGAGNRYNKYATTAIKQVGKKVGGLFAGYAKDMVKDYILEEIGVSDLFSGDGEPDNEENPANEEDPANEETMEEDVTAEDEEEPEQEPLEEDEFAEYEEEPEQEPLEEDENVEDEEEEYVDHTAIKQVGQWFAGFLFPGDEEPCHEELANEEPEQEPLEEDETAEDEEEQHFDLCY